MDVFNQDTCRIWKRTKPEDGSISETCREQMAQEEMFEFAAGAPVKDEKEENERMKTELEQLRAKLKGQKKSKRNHQRNWLKYKHDSCHNIFTHFPKDPDCEICNACKTQHQWCKSWNEKPDATPEPTKFGDKLTADHAINLHGRKGRKGGQYHL